MVNTRIIGILSGKGGVGKTTLALNLGAALTDFGKNVLIVDGNLTTPNLGIHAGIPLYPTSMHDVLKGNVDIYDVMHIMYNGLKIVPASINLNDLKGVDPDMLSTSFIDLAGKIDFLLIDGAPGLGSEALSIFKASHEVLGISTPELPALTDLLKSVRLAKDHQKEYIGSVVNMVTKKKYEPNKEQIESFLEGVPILELVPHDHHVRHALSKRVPVIYHKPNAKSSLKIKSVAAQLAGKEYKIPWHKKIFNRI